MENKLALSLNLPQVSFNGVDIESFLFENVLDLNKLKVTGGGSILKLIRIMNRRRRRKVSRENLSQNPLN
ncbi:hypothetical protein V8V91_18100 [Algoriphagus halophilus]|uniref:hypothetical protein n=1 Tax=Algoriphagus halophilus TaxID=226505 RepID=UPI00358FF471